LFIDEAHHLYKPDNERDYGSEAVELFTSNGKSKRRFNYYFRWWKDKIDGFFNSNPGFLHVLETM
jgi:hypothetical protein